MSRKAGAALRFEMAIAAAVVTAQTLQTMPASLREKATVKDEIKPFTLHPLRGLS